ncbi:ATP-binding protein [Vibrio sp. EA2]|uniref:ATP-binding protein n=1 Tax=Vibrio sp. EA2 TaxID=3079860 RepID=UPI0029491551|nr:AAA family ATPase [Vibrio sp. EA2]MDV6250472.1 AAA family ATPase [Vibrio sp. EA2]
MTSTLRKIAELKHWAEWQRIELLSLCLLAGKEGPSKQLIEELRVLQKQSQMFRQTGWWSRLQTPLSHFQVDILCCVFAPFILPRVGLLYQSLQSNQQQYPSLHTIASLLALADDELNTLRETLRELERLGLIIRPSDEPFVPIQPDRLALAKVMGWEQQCCAPQGAFPLKLKATWQDLILPDEQALMLKEFLYWIKHRKTVIDEWGGQQTGGPVALFAGSSGTGKTLAAAVLANELDWPIFRVDLSALVSKYIGETEKNIGRLFDATHGRQVILFFDEADSIMGKRGELKEARDRYANMEVSYLLARIEEHDGPCILATNLRSQIDKAFCRRFQMVIEFPKPDVAQRQKLWTQLMPPQAPLGKDLNIDLLASAVSLSGGQIRNAALHAAYLAAEEQDAIQMRHIALAVLRELSKSSPQVKTNQLGKLTVYLEHGNSGEQSK